MVKLHIMSHINFNCEQGFPTVVVAKRKYADLKLYSKDSHTLTDLLKNAIANWCKDSGLVVNPESKCSQFQGDKNHPFEAISTTGRESHSLYRRIAVSW